MSEISSNPVESKPLGTMVIYAAGGAGINIGTVFEEFKDSKIASGFASIRVHYIDTSTANFNGRQTAENIYRVPGRDGSGGVRITNAKEIAECMPDVLLKFPPGDINIVLGSLSGGSGSVIGPIIAGELLSRKESVIAVGIASSDTRKRLENSITTLKSYEGQVNRYKRALTMVYEENEPGKPFEIVDQQVIHAITTLSSLFSRQNKALDTEDLRNWLDFPKSTNHPVKLAALGTYEGPVNGVKATIMSVATLARPEYDTYLGQTVGYQQVGYVSDAAHAHVKLTQPLHFAILDGVIQSAFRTLDERIKSLDEQERANRRDSGSLIDSTDQVSDNGMVF